MPTPYRPFVAPAGYPEDLPSAEVKRRFLSLLGDFAQPSVPLNLRVTEETELPGDLIQQRVEYDVEPHETVPALHLFCRGLADDAPGVLCIHAHGGDAIFPHGKAYHAHPQPDDPTQYTYRAALAGFRVLAPDALCFGERSIPGGWYFMDEINAHCELVARGKSFAWKSVWDNSRALEALELLGCTSLGSMGWSGGSTQNYILTAVNPKVKAAACFFSFATLRHQFYQYRLGHCLYHYVPNMVSAGIDWDQVVALAAPRKLLFGWGGQDGGSPEEMYRAFVDAVEARCRAEGLPPSLVCHEEADIAHDLTESMLTDALRFLQQNL